MLILLCVNVFQDADRVHLEPASPDDWEILELNQSYIEEQFINQVNILFENAVIPMWIHQQTVINLRIVKIEPTPPTVSLIIHCYDIFLFIYLKSIENSMCKNLQFNRSSGSTKT